MLASSFVRGARGPPSRSLGRQLKRSYNFASSRYTAAFNEVRPAVDTTTLRAQTLQFMDSFPGNLWHDEPVQTVLNGVSRGGDSAALIETLDAFGRTNGSQVLASAALVDEVIQHAQQFQPPARDIRQVIRSIEAVLLSTHAAELVGNQALDFGKQG